MALQQEVFVRDIQENLFSGAEFIERSTSHDAFVENKVVHLPQAGSIPTIVVNRTLLPAPIESRLDTEVTYVLDQFTTDPTLVTDLDELQTAYNKRASVLSNHTMVITERIGDEAADRWAPIDNSVFRVLRTTGAGTAALPPGATGTRKRVTKEDISSMAKLLDKDKGVPRIGRILLMQTDMFYELFEINELTSRDFAERTAIPDGVITRLFGFDIMIRPFVALYNGTSDVKKALGAATATTDSFACLAWHPSFVAKALGSIKVFADEDKPEFFGSIFSTETMFGARRLRADDKGVVALIQDAS